MFSISLGLKSTMIVTKKKKWDLVVPSAYISQYASICTGFPQPLRNYMFSSLQGYVRVGTFIERPSGSKVRSLLFSRANVAAGCSIFI